MNIRDHQRTLRDFVQRQHAEHTQQPHPDPPSSRRWEEATGGPRMPLRLHISRQGGVHLRGRYPEYANVTRPARSKFANPFTVGPTGDVQTAEEAVDLYRGWLVGDPDIIRCGLDPRRLQRRGWTGREPWLALHGAALVAAVRAELPGRPLACWCGLPGPGEPDICHAAILLRVAAGGEP